MSDQNNIPWGGDRYWRPRGNRHLTTMLQVDEDWRTLRREFAMIRIVLANRLVKMSPEAVADGLQISRMMARSGPVPTLEERAMYNAFMEKYPFRPEDFEDEPAPPAAAVPVAPPPPPKEPTGLDDID